MDGRIFGVLLWKHCCVRKRRFIFTILEYFTPLVLFIVLFLCKHTFFDGNTPTSLQDSVQIQTPEPFKLSQVDMRHSCVLYTPVTDFTRLLMRSVGKKLDLKQHEFFNGGHQEGYIPFSNTSEISNFTRSKEMSEEDAVIIFENDFVIPDNLKYTIRMKEDFMTQYDTSLDGELTPHMNFGTIYEKFMRLQWAIDTSFLEMRTGKQVKQDVTLQEFPYAERASSKVVSIIIAIVTICFFVSLIITFMLLVGRLVGERVKGVQELMKMSGVSSAQLALVHFLDTLPGMLAFSVGGAVLLTVGSPPLLEHTNGFLLFVCLFLYSCTIVSLAFVCGYLLKNLEYANSISFCIFNLVWIGAGTVLGHLPGAFQPLLGILPCLPIRWVLEEMHMMGKYGIGLDFKTMMVSHDPKTPSVLVALLFMLLQTLVLMTLAWYLDHVYPGKLGLAMPWNFFLQKQYWLKSKNNVEPQMELDEEPVAVRPAGEQYFEPPPPAPAVGIRVLNITKIYPKQTALNNVSLDVYKGELTILLGHNGAGKTTLMSIMTGTMNPTKGQVLINGQDIMDTPEVRSQIGFCPQHNMFDPKLSVIEHVVLFSMLRGQSRAEAWKSSALLLERLRIGDKAWSLSSSLSGGMQRRLQMACALAGDASVVVLDEPSSGLDVETRRSLWDLILGLRGNRTVLISTHFMEEADALGDRVAALHQGLLRCHASPMYLKKAIGTGYRLSFTTVGRPNETAIGDLVRSIVPGATTNEVTLNSIHFALPAKSSSEFPRLFAKLEENKVDLGIETIGVGVSTLEEVFLELCSDYDTSWLSQDEIDGLNTDEPARTKTGGPCLLALQMFELMKRQVCYIWHKKYSFAIWQIIIPVTVVALLGSQLSNEQRTMSTNATARALDVGMYEPTRQFRALYKSAADGDSDLSALRQMYPTVEFQRAADVAEEVLEAGKKDILEYQKYLAGIELNDTNAKVMYTTTVRHAAPAALSMLANVLASMLAAPARLTVVNSPLDPDKPLAPPLVIYSPKEQIYVLMFTFFVTSIMLYNLINAVQLPIKERVSGTRHLHVMSGCAPELHWSATLYFRTAVNLLTFIAPVVVVCACDVDRTFNELEFLMAWLVLLVLGTMAFLSFVYLVSFHFNQTAAGVVLSIVVFLNMLMYVVGNSFMPRPYQVAGSVSRHVFPAHAALHGLAAAALRAHLNAQCALNRHLCPLAPLPPTCCVQDGNVACMFCFEGEKDEETPAYSMVLLATQFLIYMSLVLATQRGIFGKICEKFKSSRYSPEQPHFSDEMVRAERTYVSKAIDLPVEASRNVMLASDVHKVHNTWFNRVAALKGISFSVKKGECLGLLGVNGAGKSTAFRILTGEDWATRGDVYADGRHRRGFTTDYMHGMGYCPQFLGLDEFLTGRQNLRLLLTLKGLGDAAASAEAKSWIKVVGLKKYEHRNVGGYSGGCQRRLAAAASLSMGAPLTLLDEPTSGVDVSARRRVWAAITRGLKHQRSIIITSHSMDEMEALCDRIAIMSRGEVCALGSPAALRAAHAQGHAVVIKLKPPTGDCTDEPLVADVTDSNPLNQLKGALVQKFDCTLKDEHRTMLHYHINETMQYSKIFQEMETLKSMFPEYVEDYSITETTLEEVFLSFADASRRKIGPSSGDNTTMI